MFQTIVNAFKIKELRRRIGFTFLMLIVVRIGCQLPVPGVDSDVFSKLFDTTGEAMNFFDAITGGSFAEMSIFALNITPYITSSIIMQLLTIAFPKLEEISRDGEEGRKIMIKITRYVTIGLALTESLAMAIGFGRNNYLEEFNVLYVLMVVASLTAGSAVLMWIGERITEKGVGNGISIVLTINIISRIPANLTSLYEQFIAGNLSDKAIAKGVLNGVIIAAIVIGTVILVVYLQDAERRIPIQYSGKMAGGRQMRGAASHIPLKVNTGGVMPVIFAQSIMQTPVIICTLLNKGGGTDFWSQVLKGLSQSNWFDTSNWIYTIGAAVYVLLVIAFAYFYTTITFNPIEISKNLKSRGGTIPGVRPGEPTTAYLNGVLNHIVFIGAVGLCIVSLIPIFFNGIFNASVSFGGTSIIIIVGVTIETLKQIESQMMVRNYKGFLND